MTVKTEEIFAREGLKAPKKLTLSVTGVCNLRCAHCWVDAGLPSSPAHAPTDALKRLAAEFADLGGTEICFTGGEPLTHPSWRDLVEYARGRFAAVGLQTNGVLLNDAAVKTLKDMDFAGLSIQVSLDGASAMTHDLMRGRGAFSFAMDGLTRLADAGLGRRVTIFFTEMGHNLGNFPALLSLAKSLGLASVVAGGLVACGRASGETPAASPVTEAYLSLLDRFQADDEFRTLYADMGTMAAVEWLKDGSAPPPECCNFAEHVYITPEGTLYPCVLCHAEPFSVSGVHEKGLERAWEEAIPLWAELTGISRARAESIALCRDCPERTGCAGGCIGRAWGTKGDLMAPDDRCEMRQAVGRLKRLG